MAHHMRSHDLPLAEHVENPETPMRDKTQASRIASPNLVDDGSHPTGRDENTRSVSDHMSEMLEQAGAEWDREHPTSGLFRKPRRTCDEKVSRPDIQAIVEKMPWKALDRMDDHIVDVAEQMVIDALETGDIDHNKAFVKGVLCSGLNTLLLSIMKISLESDSPSKRRSDWWRPPQRCLPRSHQLWPKVP